MKKKDAPTRRFHPYPLLLTSILGFWCLSQCRCCLILIGGKEGQAMIPGGRIADKTGEKCLMTPELPCPSFK